MKKYSLLLFPLLAWTGCGSSDQATAGPSGAAGAGTAGAAGSGTAGSGTAGSGTAGTAGGDTAGPIGPTGNPDGACSAAIPARGQLVDTSNPTTVVGTGSADSCTFSALDAAVAKGGIITFDCGGAATIAVTATLNLPIDKDTVIDGHGEITLDGGGAVQILNFNSPNFQATEFGVTLQRIALKNGKTTPTEVIPTAPAPCSQGFNDGEGGALYMRDGTLTVIDSLFEGNRAAPLGPDTGGGAIYVLGSKNGVMIVHSTFKNNQASNAGALGGLFSELQIYDSLFSDNQAVGHDANNNDPNQCTAMNNGQNEIGSGGNGGAIYSDGNDVDVLLCGDAILNNAAGVKAFGGGLFFTSNNYGGALTIQDTTMTGNSGGHWTNVQSGATDDAGTAVGTNCKSLTITNSTVQGLQGVQ